MHVAASSVQLHRDAAVQLQGFVIVLVGVAQLQVEKGGGVGIKQRPGMPSAQMQLDPLAGVDAQQPGRGGIEQWPFSVGWGQQQPERATLRGTEALGGVHVARHRCHLQWPPWDAHHVVTQLSRPEAQLRILLPRRRHVVHFAQGRTASIQTRVQQGPRLQGLMLDHGNTVCA